MRIRIPFAIAFLVLILLSAYLGLSSYKIPSVNDKLLHFATFFLLTLCFYWILDTSRRRNLNTTLLCVTFGLGIGSEVVQHFVPNGRTFDALDIAPNFVGSLFALGICSLYHKRMLDRRRKRKGYGAVPQEGEDVELGEGSSAQENGVMPAEVDEDTEAWDEMGGEESAEGEGGVTPSTGSVGEEGPDMKK